MLPKIESPGSTCRFSISTTESDLQKKKNITRISSLAIAPLFNVTYQLFTDQ
jgi:hypothetical protein